MSSPIHFYLTFNPHLNTSYSDTDFTQAHEFFSYLEKEIKKDKNSYAYWGKIIGKDRTSSIDITKFQEVIKRNNERKCSTHLYISDFRNLWVGKVVDVSKSIGSDYKTIDFYKDKNVELWFKLSDFTLLEYTPEGTARKLAELYIDNPYVNLKIDELSPFTTAIRYPVFVQDLSEEMFFDDLDCENSETHLILKFNPAVVSNGVSRVTKSVMAMAIPEAMYMKMPHAARNEIEAAELDILEQRHHNITKIAFSYIKALEIVINDLTINHIKRMGLGDNFFVNPESMPPKLYLDDSPSGVIPISRFHHNYSLTQLIFFCERCVESNHMVFRKAFADHKPFLKYITQTLLGELKQNQIAEIRGIIAHNDSDRLRAEDALAVRNLILGVGHAGLIPLAYQTFYPNEFKNLCHVQGRYEKKKDLKIAS